MLITYLVALALGGTFVLASLLFGGDGDAQIDADFDADVDLDADMDLDADADVDADADADADADGDADSHGHGGLVVDGLMAWLPVTSLRFWTFFAAFFGLTGTIFTAFGLISSPIVVAIVSASIGYLAGWSIVALLRFLSRNQGDATVSERDYVGASGMVMIPVASDRIGKVRLELKGRTIDLLAATEDSTPLAAREPVMVYGVSGDHILVTRAA